MHNVLASPHVGYARSISIEYCMETRPGISLDGSTIEQKVELRELRRLKQNMSNPTAIENIDLLIIGAGPAGLAAAVEAYQRLGCWAGELAIPEDLYEQAVTVFEHAGQIRARHPYSAVARLPDAR